MLGTQYKLSLSDERTLTYPFELEVSLKEKIIKEPTRVVISLPVHL
jgi:hypothetical protein